MTSLFKGFCLPCLYGVMVVVCFFGASPSCDKSEEKGDAESNRSSLPVIRSVKITPEKPLSSSHLQAVVEYQGFAQLSYSYCWKKNGKEIVGVEESILESDNFSKGDTITVEVTPYQDEIKGETKKSDPVIILNSPPVVRSASMEPSPAHSRDDLRAEVDAFDSDGDYIRYSYQWENNDEDIAGETDATLSHAHFKRGDKVSYRLGVSDEESDEIVFHSNVATILNSSPIITSQPSGRIEGWLYEYAVVAEDPDGDPLEFKLSSAPEDMTIDSSSGLIRWKVGEKQKDGSYEFKVMVSDSEGAMAIQPITLDVSSQVNS